MGLTEPTKIDDINYRYDSFSDGKVLLNKKKNKLPAMGWNSWNAFGSGNTEALTKIMADKLIELGLDKLGYKYLVLDDGCYKSERIDGKLSNEAVKFPNGFKALSDYIHAKGLKFGMYNDIGTNLCAGAAVGTCGHESTDAQSYVDWGVDFLKIDNCYYLWDNATFSNPANAKYVYCPNIKSITVTTGTMGTTLPIKNARITGQGVRLENDYATNIGTFDGTNTGTTPIGERSGELEFEIEAAETGKYTISVEYASGEEPGIGNWLQLAVGKGKNTVIYYDNLLPPTKDKLTFEKSAPIEVELKSGKNIIRIMNHRRQENTLCSYAAMLEGLNKANPNHDILLSLCEWGKTQPHNWGYKVADSWRILNDITFRVGSDGDAGYGAWADPGTPSVTSQYNKAVIMDEFAGLEKGWNDPDMLMIGMKGLSSVMNKTHFTMWCMMNSPLMLGLDLRRITKGDELYQIISNANLIALNQDKLGIQAKRIFTTATTVNATTPDKDYIQDNERADILAKPLSDGSIAISFINLSEKTTVNKLSVNVQTIQKMLGKKMPANFTNAKQFTVTDLWADCKFTNENGVFEITGLSPCDNVTYKITPNF